jgi:hypothetical protein
MTCRRICRELLWLARFGEFGPSSQPHLDHLASCRGCRDEVGFDRAMVEQLRTALAARIKSANPPSTAWEGILARAQAPEPAPAARLWEWSTGLIGRLRWATAMAGTGLALVLALNMEIVPMALPSTNDAERVSEPTSLQQVPRIPVQVSSLAQLAREWGGAEGGPARPDPEAVLTLVGRVQPPARSSEVEAAEPAPVVLRLVVRPMQTPDPGPDRVSVASVTEAADAAELVDSEPGRPS